MRHLVETRINLNAARHNLNFIKNRVGENKPIMAMIKADAYGHGAVEMARFYKRCGLNDFGVAQIREAIELREAGIEGRIMVLQPCFYGQYEDYLKWHLEAVVSNREDLDVLRNQVPFHVMVDTGMGREGLLPKDVPPFIEHLPAADKMVGIATHFAQSDESDPQYTLRQIACFEEVLQSLPAERRQKLTIHAANSGAIVNFKQAHYHMVRPGILLYGLYAGYGQVTQEAVMSVHAKLVVRKKVGAGYFVGYGSTYKTERPSTLGVLSLGYADGFLRANSNCTRVWLGDESFDIVGRVSMDQVVINLEQKDLPLGTEFLVYGGNRDRSSSLFEEARQSHTITYERACQLGSMRIPRIYLNEDL
ncbi:MAG: alanine racemase [Acidobacteria bacterium]|nr:MAG: alanine racemase [Acidobacteriota bacterium]